MNNTELKTEELSNVRGGTLKVKINEGKEKIREVFKKYCFEILGVIVLEHWLVFGTFWVYKLVNS